MRFETPAFRRKERATELLTKIGFGDLSKHGPSELSGAAAACSDRKGYGKSSCYCPDEPTGAMDTKTREIIVGFLKELCEEGQTILVVTHGCGVAD